ncbi:MAG TPA: hypothetical protein VIM53_00620 [Candidatus Saccharimonadales bacterium]
MLRKLLNGLVVQNSTQDQEAELYRDIIRYEAKVGGRLFGPVAKNVRREFFCLDEHTWVWYEEWTDEKGKRHSVTTRYDVRPNGVLKAQDGHPYRHIEAEEAWSLYHAVSNYNQRVDAELYGLAA